MWLRDRHPLIFTGLIVACLSVISNLLILWINPALIYHALAYLIIVISFITVSVLIFVFGPPQNRYRKAEWLKPENYVQPPINQTQWNIILDTHSHTKAMEGQLTINESVFFHHAMGFNAMVVTEHNTMRNFRAVMRAQKRYRRKFIVLPDMEWTTARIHLCLIGISKWIHPIPITPTDVEIRQTIQNVHQEGGVVAVCHYPWSTGGPNPRMPDHPTREQMMEWGVDLFEVANWDDDIDHFDSVTRKFIDLHPEVGPCVGTDMHYPERTRICGWTVLNAKNFTPKGVLEELRNRRTQVILTPHALPYPIFHPPNPTYQIFRPLIMIGGLFRSSYLGGKYSNIDVFAVIMLVIFFFIGFWFLELCLYLQIF